MKKVIAITGPTASGKTDLSLKVAQKFNLEIINCDAAQFYQYYNIGTAKIRQEQMQGVKHHLLDFIPPYKNYSIYYFQKDARQKIETIKFPLFVGGSGLYLQSVLFDYQLLSKPLIKKSFSKDDLQYMLLIIKQKDPCLVLDIKNSRRIISAYYDLKTGILRSSKIKSPDPLYCSLIFYLDVDRNILKKRVILRLEQMLQQGFIEEVRQLQIYFPHANFNIIGYREIKLFLEGKNNLVETKNLIIQKTMQYAKRQKTWFKNQLKPIILNALSPDLEQKIIKIVADFLKKN